jgi:hypothetical protein
MRAIIGLAALICVSGVAAQTCDMEWSTTGTATGKPGFRGSFAWQQLPIDSLSGNGPMAQASATIMKTWNKIVGTQGPVHIVMEQKGTCPGNGQLIADLTYNDVQKLVQAQQKAGDDLMKVWAKRGDKHPWKD